jgi:diguanylate cyclase (GGDEF)-like protein/PAS domain S-box-containing protein
MASAKRPRARNAAQGANGSRRETGVAATPDEIRERQRFYRELVENASDVVYVHDLDGNFTEVNAAAERVYGYAREEILRLNVRDIVDPQYLDVALETTAARLRGDDRREPYDLLTRARDGRPVWVEVNARVVLRDGKPVGVQGICRDITRRKQAEDALRDLSRRDSLTGMLNHGAANATLREILAGGAKRCAVVMCDVDSMKSINDTYGHPVGDAVLTIIASALAREGAIVGRYGGDEFIVILEGLDRDAAEAYRDRVAEAVAAAELADPATGVRIPIEASLGIAVYPDEARRPDELVKLADNAMYATRRHRDTLPSAADEILSGDRAAKLVGDLVPLLTAPGTREEKLAHVASRLSVGAGYDAVNFEISGSRTEPQDWEGTYVRAPEELQEAWTEAQNQATDHPLGRLLEETRTPVFLDDIATAEPLLPEERVLISAAGLKSALVVPMIWQNRLVGMLSVASRRPGAFTAWDARFLTAVSGEVTAIVWMTTLVEELRLAQRHLSKAHDDTVMLLASAAEAHDDTTGRHIQRVRKVSEAIARELGYSEARSHEIGLASVLHDVGKFYVPDAILRKPAKLTDEEWVVMRSHAVWGAEFLSGKYGFDLAETIARTHHESWDGSGYPAGLKGDEIPEATLITSAADAFDAMTNDRPYRPGRPAFEAIEELVRFSGRQFSPQVVDAMVRLYERGALPYAEDTKASAAA